MLLINFFKKASRLFNCKKKNVLMLFLFSKPIQFILVSCFFLNYSSAFNLLSESDINNFQLRIKNANQEFYVQDINFSIYLIIGLSLIAILSIIIIINLKRVSSQGLERIIQLNEALILNNDKIFRQQQQMKLYSNLFDSLNLRLNQIRKSISALCVEFSIKDHKLKNEIRKINAFVTKMDLEYSQSVVIIEKL